MPARLLVFIIVVAILISFIGLNLTNTCDLSLGFKVFRGVPVYLTVFMSFMMGMMCSLPFLFIGRSGKKSKEDRQAANPETPKSRESKKPSIRKGFFGKKPGEFNN